jgi:Lar family restriction alleviation protein
MERTNERRKLMTNGEKFKTAIERREAFKKYFSKCFKNKESPKEEFAWLELEDKEEILKCPFCGSKADINTVGNKYFVRCHDCLIETPLYSSYEEVIAAWNRRAK